MSATPAADPERLRRLNALLEVALSLPAGEREAWLGTLPPDQRSLTPILKIMLARAYVETDSFMRCPVAVAVEGVGLVADTDEPGDLVGPYRLISELGSGGMATVWLAERADGSLQRHVALKLPHASWATGLAQRMAHERDILAALEHPQIARLYDAGVTARGRPWLAMEHVSGSPIDKYCRTHHLDLPPRLHLFLQVAEAVAFAHARLVVHRDLKPSNILVTASGDVRLLDFGVAKLLKDDAAAISNLTRSIGRPATPEYASPEQMSGRPVTVAADVYSLGVLLYELLTGERPYVLPPRSAAGLEEAILAADIPPASSRVRNDRRLARALRGDLDTVLGKALRKHPEERYSSVEALAADVRHYLEGAPVLARPAGRWYRTVKFVRRHRAVVGMSAIAAIALVAGAAVAGWQWYEARAQREVAVARLVKAEAALDFADAVLTEATTRDENISLDELLDRSRRFIAHRDGGDPVARAVAAGTLASWYLSYGAYDSAEPILARAIEEFPRAADESLARHLSCKHAHALSKLGREGDAVRMLGTAIDASTSDAATAAYCLTIRSFIARDNNDADAALALAERALGLMDAAGLPAGSDRAVLKGEIAYAHSLQGRADLADREFREALAQLSALGRDEGHAAIALRNNWGIAVLAAGNPRRALGIFDAAGEVAIRRSPTGELPAYLIGNRAQALRGAGRYAEAFDEYARMRQVAHVAGNPSWELFASAGEAFCALKLGRIDEAQARLDEAQALARNVALSPASPASRGLAIAQAEVWRARGRQAEARSTLTRLIDAGQRRGDRTSAMVAMYLMRGEIATAEKHLAAAREDLDRALTLARATQAGAGYSHLTGQVWLALGKLHARAGRRSEADAAFKAASQHLASTLGKDNELSREAGDPASAAF